MDARTRICGRGGGHYGGGSRARQARDAQSTRADYRATISNGVSCAEDDAGAGYFADSGVRREFADRHDLRGSNFEPGAARQGFAQAGGARNDEQAVAADTRKRSGGTHYAYLKPRKSGGVRGDGQRAI